MTPFEKVAALWCAGCFIVVGYNAIQMSIQAARDKDYEAAVGMGMIVGVALSVTALLVAVVAS